LIFMLFLMVDIVRLDYVLQLPLDLWAIYHWPRLKSWASIYSAAKSAD
jgi:hypothetical protein